MQRKKAGWIVRLILLVGLLCASPGWGAEYYVTTTGNDAAAGSQAAPWATIGKAVTVATDGDTVWFGDGVYLTTDGANGTNYVRTQYSVAWKAINIGQVTWKANSAAYVVYAQPSAGKTPEINGIIIDAVGTVTAANAMSTSSAVAASLILTDVTLQNFTVHGYECSVNGLNITIQDLILSTTNNSGMGLKITTNPAGNIDIDGVVFALTSNANYATYYGIYYSPVTQNSGTLSIKNVTGTITTSHANAITRGVYIRNANGASISDCNFTLTAVNAATCGCIMVANTGAVLTANNASIYNNTVVFNAPVGYGIRVGTDAIGTDANDKSNDALIYGNTVTGIENGQIGTPHGIVLANNTGGKIYRNKITNFSPAILLNHTDATTTAYSNIAVNCYGIQCLYAKGATGSGFFNNDVYMVTGHSGTALAAQDDEQANHCDTVVFTNNIVYNSAASPKFTRITASNTATFSNNLYFATEDLIATSWNYQASNYATIADWRTGQEASAVWGDPLFVSATDFHILAGSPCINAGTAIGLGATFLDFDGIAMTDGAGAALGAGVDIGAFTFAGHGANGPGQGGPGLMIKRLDTEEDVRMACMSPLMKPPDIEFTIFKLRNKF